MKILYITAGAANMYCGSCLRDNALAAELMARGHDVMLVPIYTPTLTDERNVSRDHVFFGGISVYLQQHHSLFRKTPRLLDRLWDSAWALKLASRRSIPTNPKLLGELTVSMLKGEDGNQRKELLKMLDWLREEQPPPDVISLPYTLLIGLAKPIRDALHRPLVCTLQGEDLFLEGLHEPYRSQALELIRANVRHVDRFIAVSHYYADFMPRYLHIPQEKMRVVPLGINLEGYSARERTTLDAAPFTVGYFARIAPEKGLHLLVEAYKLFRERSSSTGEARLEVAGYLGAEHKDYLAEIEQRIRAWGLADEFHYRGVLDRQEKIGFLRGLDVLSVPATYDEPKGIFLLEAMACGVPVVQPRRGAFTEVVERTGGGLLVEPDDTESLAEGIDTLYRKRALASELGDRGFRGVREHYNVALMAERALEVYGNPSGTEQEEGAVRVGAA
ncbi:MAG TPA: glycosyltransferase family 4 protein [Pyrinomonadaceae bacterium]|jgi:glycosyltransferase involved in cell wall biosynthesis|nr:glycosyltransferase family 4 protein [Pyrinomonadaceae bacterium]